ncbi:PepSY domain-containing protein [Staphylococcus taiwanensis]|nr:PepSY domain-containing protein [Staphylococcus taiwanensis]
MIRSLFKYSLIPLAFVFGITTTIVIYFIFENNKVKHPNKVLEDAKSYFMNIRGSYILHEPYLDNDLYPDKLIYQGGITQSKNNKIIEYIFYADAKTGEVLNIVEL